jgi:hypothetical protein
MLIQQFDGMAEGDVERVDLFSDVKPHYGGGGWFEQRERVPTLFSISMRLMVEEELNSELLPPGIKAKVDQWHHSQTYKGPKVMKCSKCSKFYTKPNRFAAHECDT